MKLFLIQNRNSNIIAIIGMKTDDHIMLELGNENDEISKTKI